MDTEEYLSQFSAEFIGRQVSGLEDLTEQEADGWITKAYIQSLEERKDS